MIDFTLRKFLKLSLENQHRKCAALLREIYQKQLKSESIESEWVIYSQLRSWMKLEKLSLNNAEQISNYYHYHLQAINVSFKEHNLLPEIRKGDREKSEEVWPIAVYLDNLRSAHNVGSILRTVEAFSLGTVYFSAQTPFIDNEKVQNTSKNCHQWVSCRKTVDWENLPKPIILLETSNDAIALQEFTFPDCFTLIVGNEEYGCSEESLRRADYCIEIPLRGRKNSLNVANAFAIAAAEIARRKS